MRTLLLGLAAEIAALGIAYGIYRVFERVPLYALFYIPVYDRVFRPAIIWLGWTHRTAQYGGLAIIGAVNSLKWAGDILLFQKRRWILATLLTAILLATVFIAISLKGMPI